MKIGYLAITDICNYKCVNCPYKSNVCEVMKYEEIGKRSIKRRIETSGNIL